MRCEAPQCVAGFVFANRVKVATVRDISRRIATRFLQRERRIRLFDVPPFDKLRTRHNQRAAAVGFVLHNRIFAGHCEAFWGISEHGLRAFAGIATDGSFGMTAFSARERESSPLVALS